MSEKAHLDCRAEWLIRTRFQHESPDEAAEALTYLGNVRDRVLENAALREGETILDVGTGTGLLAFGALERVGEIGCVIALDISSDCLSELRRLAQESRNTYRLSYVTGNSITLPLMDTSVDVVVTRSVLIYIRDKARVAAEFFRVLRPGGRFSVFEPINRHNTRLYQMVDLGPLEFLSKRVAAEEEAWYAADDPMVSFDESDLEQTFTRAGFIDVHSDLQWREETHHLTDEYLERMLHGIGAPGRPSLLQRWQGAFVPKEVQTLVSFLRTLIGRSLTSRKVVVYLSGTKPES